MLSKVIYIVLCFNAVFTFQDTSLFDRKLSIKNGTEVGIILKNVTLRKQVQLILLDGLNQNVYFGAEDHLFMLNQDLILLVQSNTSHTGVKDYQDALTCVTDRSLVVCDWLHTGHCYMYRKNLNGLRFFVLLPDMWKSNYVVFGVHADVNKITKENKVTFRLNQNDAFNKSVPMFYGCHPSNDNKTFTTEQDRVSVNGYENIAFFHNTFVRNVSGTGLLKFEDGGRPFYLWTANKETHLTRLEHNSMNNTDHKLQCTHGGVDYTLAVAAAVQQSGTGNGSGKNLLVIFKKMTAVEFHQEAGSIMCAVKIPRHLDNRQVRDYISVDFPNGTAYYTVWKKGVESVSNNFVDERRTYPPISGEFEFSFKSVGTSLALITTGSNIVAYVGTETGSVEVLTTAGSRSPWRKVYELPLTDEAESRPSPHLFVRSSYAIDYKKRQLYLLTGKQVVKLSLNHCPVYRDCTACIQGDESGCVWCGRRCMTRDNCTGQTQYDTCTHQRPVLDSVSPNFGPKAGGTKLVLHGSHLHSLTAVHLGGALCNITMKTSTHINCTSTVHRYKATVNINATDDIDDHDLLKKYEFRPDPKINSISRNSSIYSGGTNIDVTGIHLDSVADPVMKISISDSSAVEVKPFQKNKSCLVFRVPSIKNITKGEPNARNPIVANISFLMDGAEQKSFQFRYYPDPTIHQLKNGTWDTVALDRTITIQGQNLNLSLEPHDFVITVNERINCTVSILTRESLSCKITEQLMSEIFNVEIRVGSLQFPVGNIPHKNGLFSDSPKKLPDDSGEDRSWTKLLLLLCIPLVLLLMLILLCYLYARLRLKRRRVLEETRVPSPPPGGEDTHQMEIFREGGEFVRLLSDKIFEFREKALKAMDVQNYVIPRSCLTMEEEIGQGNFGTVYKAQLLHSSDSKTKEVAVKTFKSYVSMDDKSMEAFLEEGVIMTQFQHRHVMTLIGFCIENTEQPMFILPLMKHGDLRTYIQDEKHAETCTIGWLTDYARQIAEGMEYLAKNRFIHRDLAARNCMLDENLTVKVADFGFSKDIYERNYYRSGNKAALPVKWMSPESIESGINTTKSDVWSYGIVLWELMTRGKCPYPGVENWDLIACLKNGRRLEKPTLCPDEIYSIMMQCWQYEPRKRPTFSELVNDIMHAYEEMNIYIKMNENKI